MYGFYNSTSLPRRESLGVIIIAEFTCQIIDSNDKVLWIYTILISFNLNILHSQE